MGNQELRRGKQYDFYKYHFTVYSKSRKTSTTKIELKMSMLMASYLNL